jgi:hypothetical protein
MDRKIVIYPRVDFCKAEAIINAYVLSCRKQRKDYFEWLKEEEGYLANWDQKTGKTIQVGDREYVRVYATPTQIVIKRIEIPEPVLRL